MKHTIQDKIHGLCTDFQRSKVCFSSTQIIQICPHRHVALALN